MFFLLVFNASSLAHWLVYNILMGVVELIVVLSLSSLVTWLIFNRLPKAIAALQKKGLMFLKKFLNF